jgi:hypothetical protein
MSRRYLLYSGIVASLLYVATTFAAPLFWEGYDSAAQTVSELFAIDAPSRMFVTPLFALYSILMIAFGLGIWHIAGRKRGVRAIGGLLIAREVLGLYGSLFAPIHLRGEPGTFSDTMHAIITMIGVLIYLVAMSLGVAVLGKRFRLYSIGTLLILAVFGALAGMQGPDLAANLPTPMMGVWERINIFATMLWIIVLAFTLLRTTDEENQQNFTRKGGGSSLKPDPSQAI